MYRHVYNKEVHQPHFGMTSSAVKKRKRPLYKDLDATNQGLSRRVKNLEDAVTFLLVVAGVSTATAFIF